MEIGAGYVAEAWYDPGLFRECLRSVQEELAGYGSWNFVRALALDEMRLRLRKACEEKSWEDMTRYEKAYSRHLDRLFDEAESWNDRLYI